MSLTEASIPRTDLPLSWAAVGEMAPPDQGPRMAYGDAPQQYGELRLPSGPGPHPVVVLIHGGCWLNAFDLDYFAHWADWLAEFGYASWNVEYRRLGDPGGGWPGTLLDVGRAIDHLRVLAREQPLDLGRVWLAGHSAGGQLALWAASRAMSFKETVLQVDQPLPVAGVIGLAPIVDLADYRIGPPGSCHASVDQLIGGSPAAYPRRYADASPIARRPLATPVTLIVGSEDAIVPPEHVRRLVDAAPDGPPRLILLPGAGHFDTGVPTPASSAALRAVLPAPGP